MRPRVRFAVGSPSGSGSPWTASAVQEDRNPPPRVTEVTEKSGANRRGPCTLGSELSELNDGNEPTGGHLSTWVGCEALAGVETDRYLVHRGMCALIYGMWSVIYESVSFPSSARLDEWLLARKARHSDPTAASAARSGDAGIAAPPPRNRATFERRVLTPVSALVLVRRGWNRA